MNLESRERNPNVFCVFHPPLASLFNRSFVNLEICTNETRKYQIRSRNLAGFFHMPSMSEGKRSECYRLIRNSCRFRNIRTGNIVRKELPEAVKSAGVLGTLQRLVIWLFDRRVSSLQPLLSSFPETFEFSYVSASVVFLFRGD